MPRRTTPRTAVMNTHEAAIYLGLTASTLEKMRTYSENGPPFAGLGSSVRYRIADLDAWLAERIYRSTKDRARRRKRGGPNGR
ncbi:putative DNA-binding transcriptional regulator AlpA [Sphingomonas sp. UYAg733]